MSTLETLATLVRDLGAERAGAVRLIESLRQQRDALDTAPLPRKEVEVKLSHFVDQALERFDANVTTAIERILHRPAIELREFPFLTMMDGSGALDERLLTALLADAVRGRVKRIIAAMDWPEAGPPASERPALRAQLDEQISTVQTALNEIDTALAQMGVNLEASRGR